MIFLKNHRLWFRTICLLLSCMILISPVTPVSATADTGNSTLLPDQSNSSSGARPVCKIRYSPHPGTTIIGCLEDNTKLTILGTYGNYYQIDCFDMTGYILRSQVSISLDGTYRVSCQENSSETKYLSTHNSDRALQLMGQLREEAMLYVGVRYVIGGTTPRGFDCSGYTKYVLGKHGYDVLRTVDRQLQSGVIIAKEDLQCGDLVFFKYTANGQLFSHVGIYIGNNEVIHASSTRGVKIDNLDEPYYTQHYLCSRRIILSDMTSASFDPTFGATQNLNSSFWKEPVPSEPSENLFGPSFSA